ncbi:MAG: 3-dehydroquinate synthase [Saprospiraceae bacterium]|jgi:3-dehydroquinate synthase|uniref:3-dehydroquinate synthase n=1 Tax=Candidatus Brachybacter algidus TaxID=2982024 RepID=UPI001B6A82AB|nr:3-dehydroquinate synthase [Candidatus Brachybacter algidus]MBP8893852.1 3-dehydroquinate synthase [Saprospiraceae bacterium]MBK6371847.1 3-dehydroquinate synthase [Candidatus Brachybacter algidus]MBK6448818.1 3-dehydroquinate synthase [Candidatus Brachybacter algidus]MBK7603727.1 3-dehydroquinate synthase [Candidatus Brachybacter algidus]MBK8746522.1 3-dehydroquinate synthase [Candidatus Brachybacter algidus]
MKPDIINVDGCPLFLDQELSHFKAFLANRSYSSYIILGDENTIHYCYPLIRDLCPSDTHVLKFPAGESQKNITTCSNIWQQLLELKVDRKSLVILLGGGVVGDMGGFIASTYKRGLDFVHMPTTLMSMTDSSIGGKLGIDYDHVKNAVGLFRNSKAVFIHLPFLQTLSDEEMRSGYSEIVKHALIANSVLFKLLQAQTSSSRPLINTELLYQSILVKKTLVERDPFESSVRKALNFGHTIGHAIESYKLKHEQPITHGEAVAFGMIAETYLSYKTGLILKDHHEQIQHFLKSICDTSRIRDIDLDEVFNYLQHDKKNESGKILFSLLNGIGSFSINKDIPNGLIRESMGYLTNQ